MLSTDDLQADHQQRLLKSLQHRVSMDSMPQPKLKNNPINLNAYRSGRGSLEDHMMIMKNYICQCGHKTDLSHSMSSNNNGTALDIYKISCSYCGDEEEVSFMSMKEVLEEATGSNIQVDRNNRRLFPYL